MNEWTPKKPAGKSWYMHTIDDRPAHYSPRNKQITYVSRFTNKCVLVDSLATIRKEQELTRKQRAEWFGDDDGAGKYGYIRFARVAPRKRKAQS
jgi:hypothetical protein